MRLAPLCAFGAALICAAFLVACGGGGGSSPIAGGSGSNHVSSNQQPGTHVTITYTQHAGFKPKSLGRRGAQSIRTPKYLSGAAMGMQITVSATGVASQTVYADLTSSAICSGSPTVTCTITVPTLAANEQFSLLETNNSPLNSVNGYGTGFATNTNILAATNTTESITLGGTNNLAIEMDPVAGGGFVDCTGGFSALDGGPGAPNAGIPTGSNATFGEDPGGYNNATDGDIFIGGRIVVTGGVAASGSLAIVPLDAGTDCAGLGDTTPAPYVDVNASPTPITVSSNSSAVVFAPVKNNATAPPGSGYAQTASIATDAYVWETPNPPFFFIGVNTSSSFSGSSSTIVLNNNLTALNTFLSPPSSYATTMTLTIVPITVSSTAVTLSSPTSTNTVTGTDPGAYYGMDAESSYTANNGSYWYNTGGGDENCKTGGGTTLATVSSNGSINTTNWTQSFTITGAGAGTGTCTFYLFDLDALTITQPVTVTVN